MQLSQWFTTNFKQAPKAFSGLPNKFLKKVSFCNRNPTSGR